MAGYRECTDWGPLSAKSPELKQLSKLVSFKVWSRSECSHACFTCCQEFCLCVCVCTCAMNNELVFTLVQWLVFSLYNVFLNLTGTCELVAFVSLWYSLHIDSAARVHWSVHQFFVGFSVLLCFSVFPCVCFRIEISSTISNGWPFSYAVNLSCFSKQTVSKLAGQVWSPKS